MSDPSASGNRTTPKHAQRPAAPETSSLDDERKHFRSVVYDIASGRATLFGPNGETLEEDARQSELDAKLDELGRLGGQRSLHEFAVWCARNIAAKHNASLPFVDAAEAFLRGETDRGPLEELSREHHHVALAAASIGLKVGDPTAAGYLASFACLRRDARVAAESAMQMMRLSARLEAERCCRKAKENPSLADRCDHDPVAAEIEVGYLQLNELHRRIAELRRSASVGQNGTHPDGPTNAGDGGAV